MNNHSFRQQQYLFQVKKRQNPDPCIQAPASSFFPVFLGNHFQETMDRFLYFFQSFPGSGNLCKNAERTISYLAYPHHTVRNPDQLFSCNESGILSAVILWLFPKISRILEPCLVVLNSLPKSALAPLLIVWLGASEKTIIVSGISVAIFGCILNLYTGFTEISQEKLKLIRTLGGGR